MKTGRPDLDARLQIKDMPDAEPVFVIRGRDALGADAVRAYALAAEAAGVDPAVVEQALQQADALEAWPAKKLPDADHLAEAERKQLAYQRSRRAWHTEITAEPDPLAQALAKWTCPSCGGEGVYTQRSRVPFSDEVSTTVIPCKVCDGAGLHPIAQAALAEAHAVGRAA